MRRDSGRWLTCLAWRRSEIVKVELRGEGRYIYSSGWNFETTNFVIDRRAIELWGGEKNCAVTCLRSSKSQFYVGKAIYITV